MLTVNLSISPLTSAAIGICGIASAAARRRSGPPLFFGQLGKKLGSLILAVSPGDHPWSHARLP